FVPLVRQRPSRESRQSKPRLRFRNAPRNRRSITQHRMSWPDPAARLHTRRSSCRPLVSERLYKALDQRNQVHKLAHFSSKLAGPLEVNRFHFKEASFLDMLHILGNEQHVLEREAPVNLVNGCLKDFLSGLKTPTSLDSVTLFRIGSKNPRIPR